MEAGPAPGISLLFRTQIANAYGKNELRTFMPARGGSCNGQRSHQTSGHIEASLHRIIGKRTYASPISSHPTLSVMTPEKITSKSSAVASQLTPDVVRNS